MNDPRYHAKHPEASYLYAQWRCTNCNAYIFYQGIYEPPRGVDPDSLAARGIPDPHDENGPTLMDIVHEHAERMAPLVGATGPFHKCPPPPHKYMPVKYKSPLPWTESS